MSSKYVLHAAGSGQFRFTLVSHGGQVLLTSGLFMDKESARRKIDTTRTLLRNARNYALLTAEDGGLYFTVVTRKGETLACSATSPDAEGRQAAINLAKQYNRGARFEDLTLQSACKPERPVHSGRFAARRPQTAPSPISAAAHKAVRQPEDHKIPFSTAEVSSAVRRKAESASSKFILREEGNDRYLILFQTHRGQILLTGQVRYKDVALSQIRAARTLGQNEKNYAVHRAEEGGSYFAIKNTQGETLALSETYPDPESMRQGIDLVKGCIAGAWLEDLTVKPSNPASPRVKAKGR